MDGGEYGVSHTPKYLNIDSTLMSHNNSVIFSIVASLLFSLATRSERDWLLPHTSIGILAPRQLLPTPPSWWSQCATQCS